MSREAVVGEGKVDDFSNVVFHGWIAALVGLDAAKEFRVGASDGDRRILKGTDKVKQTHFTGLHSQAWGLRPEKCR